MPGVLTRGALFPEELIPGLMNMVKGESALASLSIQRPIGFNGQKEFTFNFDREIDVVPENGAKSKGGITIAPRVIMPVKVEYSARVSDEFRYGAQSFQMDLLSAFSEGFARKVAQGFDLMALHGLNPRTDAPTPVIGDNHFDAQVTQMVTMSSGVTPDDNVEDATTLIFANDETVSGIAMSPAFRSALAKMQDTTGRKIYTELAWGNKPGTLNGLRTTCNITVNHGGSADRALVGDFDTSFRWGYAKQIPIELIEYGNPDNDTEMGDLKGHNQVMLRAEMFIGWGILKPDAFAWIKA